MDPFQKIDLLRAMLEALEWSGHVRGPGSGPMFSGNDGDVFAACPSCGGLKQANNQFTASAVGHRSSCKIARALKETA